MAETGYNPLPFSQYPTANSRFSISRRSLPMRRIALCCGLPLVGLLTLFAESSPPTKETPRPRRAGSAALPSEIEIADCRVRLLQEVELASARTGIVDTVAAEGEAVRAGVVVARLRDNLLRVARDIAEREAANDVEVRFSRKASELAQVKYIRAVDANKSSSGTVSELELRELRLAAEKSLLQIEQAEHQFLIAGLRRDDAEEMLTMSQIAAPFDGVVLDVYKQPGEVVREGELILRLASGARVRVEGFVSVEEAARLRRGMPVRVSLDSDDSSRSPLEESLSGRLTLVDIKVEPVSRKVRVWAEVANESGLLRDGLTAKLIIALRSPEISRNK
jgi:multidrug efflux pump subunit AcrA (membrane-fusion protein)